MEEDTVKESWSTRIRTGTKEIGRTIRSKATV